MGSTCTSCQCCRPSDYQPVANTEIRNQDWADAIQKGNFTAIAILHHADPGCINEPVDEQGHTALHYAVKNKDQKLLEYLLNNHVNINAQGGPDYNSALHEAVKLYDWDTIRKLFGYGINDQLRNAHGKVAVDLCIKRYKREFTKAKQFRKKHKDQYTNRHKAHVKNNRSAVMLAGLNLDDTGEKNIKEIKNYVKKTDHEQNFFRRKQEEIDQRDMAVTSFGEDTGIEVDEIAMCIKDEDLAKVWVKYAPKNADHITKLTEIHKLLFGITNFALKRKNPRSKRAPNDAVRKLSDAFVKKLPRKRGKYTLEKAEFCKHVHNLLFALHDEWVEKESGSLA